MVEALARCEAVATHRIAHVELHAALAKAVRLGRLDEPGRQAILRQAEDDWSSMWVIEDDAPLVTRAGELAGRFELRAYDSVHLAAVERLAGHMTPAGVEFGCCDRALNDAAIRLGIGLIPST